MKRILLSAFLALVSLTFVAHDVEARRLGGGGFSGMKRQMPAKQTPDSPPAQQAPTNSAAPATAGAAAAAPAAAAKRSWLGPIAGLAAGLGLAALMSHLGLGEQFANILMVMLLVAAAFFAVRLLMRRFGPTAGRGDAATAPHGMRFAPAGSAQGGFAAGRSAAGFGSGAAIQDRSQPSLVQTPPASPARVPADFDTAGFERIAKLIFIRMQAANDAADLDDLRKFATPEMFATIRLDLQDRKGAAQQTDVVQLDAQVLDVAEEAGQQIVSVRFHGLIREDKDAAAAPFDEAWHFVRPADGSREWAIAGIQQSQPLASAA